MHNSGHGLLLQYTHRAAKSVPPARTLTLQHVNHSSVSAMGQLSYLFRVESPLTFFYQIIDTDYKPMKKSCGRRVGWGGGGGGMACLLVGCLTSQQHVSVSQERICEDNFTCCHTQKLQTKLSISPSHSILTPCQPVPALTL